MTYLGVPNPTTALADYLAFNSGYPDVDYTAGPLAAGYPAGGIATILSQKWFALNGNSSVEAWTEYRRTGYPDFLITSVSSRLGAGEQLKRLLYPSSETTRNAQPQHSVTATTPVWWDK